MGMAHLSPRTAWLILGALLALWIGLIYIYLIDVPPPVEVPLKYRSGQPAARAQRTPAAETWEVHSLRAQVQGLPIAPTRNIFTAAGVARSADPATSLRSRQHKQPPPIAAVLPPSPPPPTPEELARQQEELARQQEAFAAQAAQQQAQLLRQQVQEQMGQYRYLGYANQNGTQKAFLGKGRELYILHEGETLEGKFQVAVIDPTAVKLVDNESKLETILKLKKDESSPAGT